MSNTFSCKSPNKYAVCPQDAKSWACTVDIEKNNPGLQAALGGGLCLDKDGNALSPMKNTQLDKNAFNGKYVASTSLHQLDAREKKEKFYEIGMFVGVGVSALFLIILIGLIMYMIYRGSSGVSSATKSRGKMRKK